MIQPGPPRVVAERYASRRWDPDEGYRRVYLVVDAPTEQIARAAAESAPMIPGTIPVPAGRKTQREIVSLQEKKRGQWVTDVLWVERDVPDPNATPFHDDSFEIRAPSRQIYVGETIAEVAAAGFDPPRQFKGAINVDQQDQVNGVQWPPAGNQVITRTRRNIPPASVSFAYYRALCRTAGKTNDGPYMDFQAEELLFLGARGSRELAEPSSPWQISYSFAVSLTEQDVKVGDEIVLPAKAGWHYAWPYFGTTEDTNGQLVASPIAAYVVRVAQASGFGGLIL